MERVKRVKVMVMSGVFALVATLLPQSATLNAAPAPASAPPPYTVMGQGFQKGNSGSSRLLTTAEELDAYLKVSSCNAEVTGFLNGVDFKKEEVLIYNLVHRGSGSDRGTSVLQLGHDSFSGIGRPDGWREGEDVEGNGAPWTVPQGGSAVHRRPGVHARQLSPMV